MKEINIWWGESPISSLLASRIGEKKCLQFENIEKKLVKKSISSENRRKNELYTYNPVLYEN